jgi:hypothetical protein
MQVAAAPPLKKRHALSRLGHPLILVATFVAVVAPTILRHEMWHDELNSWDVARDAQNLRGLFANMHLEAHPALWYLCLYAITRFTSDPRAMQALHLIVATGTVAIIAWASPFTRLERWLLAFGYFFVFEFAVISRGYALGILLAVAFCVAYTKPQPRIAVLALLLALLANTSLYGVFMTLALSAAVIVDGVDGRLPRRPALVAGAVVVGAATIVSLLTLYPAPDNMFARGWHRFNPTRVEGVLALAWAAYVPLPDFGAASPWNSNFLIAEAAHILILPRGLAAAVLAVALLAAAAFALRRDRAAVTALLVGTALMLVFIYLKYSGGMRHHGHAFILFIVAIWIARRGMRPGRANPALVALLVCQAVAGIYFVVQDLRGPFSFSKDLTEYVLKLPRTTPVVVAEPTFLSFTGPVLSGYLRKPVTYVLGDRVVRGSFMSPDAEHQRGATEEEITAQLQRFAAERGSDVYVVTNNWEPTIFGPALAHFDRHLEGDERTADVYLFRRAP